MTTTSAFPIPQPSPPSWPTWIARAYQTYIETVSQNPWIPTAPWPKQQRFLLHTDRLEALYGGAAGGGKTETLLMAALQYVHVPGYAALLLRRTFRDLNQPDALIPRSKEWLYGKAHWSEQSKRWTFPSGATLSFGYLDAENDIYQYQGAAFAFVGFDELTQFTDKQYLYLFSRLRRLEGSEVPIRMRAASNPGGVGHTWVKNRFLRKPDGRVFVPATMADNPSLDAEAYRRSLAELDPFTRKQLEEGDWSDFEGGRFKSRWFARRHQDLGDAYRITPAGNLIYYFDCQRFVTVDPAASEKQSADYTVIATWAMAPEKDLLLLDVVREHLGVDAIVPRIAEVCRTWGPAFVGIEDAGFQVAILGQANRHPDIPVVRPLSPQGKGKLVRATPAIIRAERGQIILPESADWLDAWLEEHVQFTGDEKEDAYDDQVDTTSYACMCADQYGGEDDQPVMGRAREL